ncbi:hypothetical protein NAEGRDRAFT_88120 [Naegleria gruberi]|uniref:Methyltransferase n=1 Tax=Naegleria gruberi TaxID=5762 RepID=D2V6S8_NAEGR|nr:uncharacterized protein NAEGRDRAFT_88120 [Naegleria gruberi]EFC47628.1 hypothetical protein NAEGRDRAFT_88120 [Naegleria gruberi]|eukprot:XP_002680372.1 hypothetical protein NAEGRDRAFT_88120 [Naegleria gruberi strain NEG-M]
MRNYIEMIENCENNGEGVYDDLIEDYSEMLIGSGNRKEMVNMDCSEGGYFYGYDMKESSFRIYDFLCENPIVVRVFPQFLNVGLALWVDGLVEIEYIIANLESFERKNIVELGSGIGLVGLFLMNILKETGRITMTDYLDCVLENCSYCCELNNIPHKVYNSEYIYLKEDKSSKNENSNLHVMKLDWMNFTEQDIELLKDTDILIAADVAYDSSVIPGLCDVTQQLFNRNRNLIILFAITKRNEKTFEYFVSEMEKRDMVVSKEISTTDLPQLFMIEDRTTVRLFEMKGRNNIPHDQ